jgi:tRNA(Ile)-lysidine synthase
MLGISKREVLAFCAQEGLEYVTDSTNADTAYARNRLRAEVMPVLEDLFAGAAERISDMTADLREDEAVLAEMADRFLDSHCKNGECPIAELRELPRAIRRRVLSGWFTNACGASLERVHLEALERLIDAAVPHSALSLPARVTVSVEHDSLVLTVGETVKQADVPSDYRIPFCMGETVVSDGSVTVCVENSEKILKVHNLSTAPYIILKEQSAIMERDLFWRPRREGDRILMGGMHRAVRRLYREAGVHPSLRARLPLLCDAEGIVWAPFCGVRDGVALAKEGLAVRLLIGESFD